MAKRTDINEGVAAIDRSTGEFFPRNATRPRKRRVSKPAEPPEVRRAKSRRRTAAWRADNDRARRPETSIIQSYWLDALLETPGLDDVTTAQHEMVGRMLAALKANGYSVRETLGVLKKRRAALLKANANL